MAAIPLNTTVIKKLDYSLHSFVCIETMVEKIHKSPAQAKTPSEITGTLLRSQIKRILKRKNGQTINELATKIE